jgi:hypothetical protein
VDRKSCFYRVAQRREGLLSDERWALQNLRYMKKPDSVHTSG